MCCAVIFLNINLLLQEETLKEFERLRVEEKRSKKFWMDLIQENYPSSSSDEEDLYQNRQEGTEDSLPRLPEDLLDKYHIGVSMGRNTSSVTSALAYWTSFIYIDWRLSFRDTRLLSQYVSQCNIAFAKQGVKFNPLFYSSLGTRQNLHLSLTPNITFLSRDQRSQFFERLQGRLVAAEQRQDLTRHEIPLDLNHPQILLSSRWLFLTFPITPLCIEEYLAPLHNVIARECKDFVSLPDNFHPHVSIARAEYSSNKHIDIDNLDLNITTIEPILISKDHKVKVDSDRNSLTLWPNAEIV